MLKKQESCLITLDNCRNVEKFSTKCNQFSKRGYHQSYGLKCFHECISKQLAIVDSGPGDLFEEFSFKRKVNGYLGLTTLRCTSKYFGEEGADIKTN